MNTIQCFIFFCLYAPFDCSSDMNDQFDWKELSVTCQSIFIKMELLDTRECNYIFAKQNVFHIDINIMKNRLFTLHDAPLLADHQSLPSKKYAEEQIKLANKFIDHFEERAKFELYHQDEILIVVAKAMIRKNIWQNIYDAQETAYYVTTRRLALGKLSLLTDLKHFPPAIPFEHLPEKCPIFKE